MAAPKNAGAMVRQTKYLQEDVVSIVLHQLQWSHALYKIVELERVVVQQQAPNISSDLEHQAASHDGEVGPSAVLDAEEEACPEEDHKYDQEKYIPGDAGLVSNGRFVERACLERAGHKARCRCSCSCRLHVGRLGAKRRLLDLTPNYG